MKGKQQDMIKTLEGEVFNVLDIDIKSFRYDPNFEGRYKLQAKPYLQDSNRFFTLACLYDYLEPNEQEVIKKYDYNSRVIEKRKKELKEFRDQRTINNPVQYISSTIKSQVVSTITRSNLDLKVVKKELIETINRQNRSLFGSKLVEYLKSIISKVQKMQDIRRKDNSLSNADFNEKEIDITSLEKILHVEEKIIELEESIKLASSRLGERQIYEEVFQKISKMRANIVSLIESQQKANKFIDMKKIATKNIP